MIQDPDVVSRLFAAIASEQDVIDQITAGTQRLQVIQQAKRDLAALDADALRQAVRLRHAALGVIA